MIQIKTHPPGLNFKIFAVQVREAVLVYVRESLWSYLSLLSGEWEITSSGDKSVEWRRR